MEEVLLLEVVVVVFRSINVALGLGSVEKT
jgi:hypothetical protein